VHTKDLENDFMDMIRLHERIIYKVISFYAHVGITTDDLYQDIILNLWKAYPSFRGDSKVSTWMYRITLNTCITYFKKSRNKVQYTDSLPDLPYLPGDNENIRQLYKLIDRLDKIEKALVLLYLEDKPYKEISEITGLSVTNVSTKIGRIKAKLKDMSKE